MLFSKATGNFIRQIDPEGSLIHVSRPNDSRKLVLLALVVKRTRRWFWQRPKYHPTDFTLGDMLLGDEPLSPVVSETDFLTYQGKFGNIISGKLDAEAGVAKVNLEGRGTSNLQSTFDKLKVEGVDVKRLLHDSNDRLVNMQHKLVQQLEKRADVLAVLKERILTTTPCPVTETHQQQGSCGAAIMGKLRSGMEVDSDVSVVIPAGTVIAYSLLELEIKKNGQFVPCLQPGTPGGFEADSETSHGSFNTLDGLEWREDKLLERTPLSALHNELQELELHLSALTALPQLTRSSLFQRLREALRDGVTLFHLENMLEEWCRGEAPVTSEPKDTDGVAAILDMLRPGPANPIENGEPGTPAYLTAAHLLVSALEVLPDEALSLLSECSADILEACNTLINRLKESCRSLPVECLPVLLQDDQGFQLARELLSSANVTLRRDIDSMQAETGDKPGVLPLVLCVAVRGLSCLCHGQN
ncbi:gasdermin-E-like [Diretmus argenteus]